MITPEVLTASATRSHNWWRVKSYKTTGCPFIAYWIKHGGYSLTA